MVYHSLTQAPQNLKEAIDWLMALKGPYSKLTIQAMGAAIYDFLSDKPVGKMEVPALEEVKLISRSFLRKSQLQNHWSVERLVGRFSVRMSKSDGGLACNGHKDYLESDHVNVVRARRATPRTIAKNIGEVVHATGKFLDEIKNPAEYKSAYGPEVNWIQSCVNDPEACAVVFVGIAPMLYTGLSSLRVACNEEALTYARLTNKSSSLGEVLEAVGCKEPECRADMSTSGVTWALRGVNREILNIIYDLAGFWAFYGKNKSGAVKAVKPTKEEQSVKPVEPVEHPAEPVEAEQPAEAIEPVEPVQEGQSAVVEEHVKAEAPVKVVKAAKSVKAAKRLRKSCKKSPTKKNRTQSPQ
ncbi:hypothetical protein, conserved [Babesia ovata]|uniref:Uncharacterized protein n=1 Tax=Babesia ovata TaxID=189622 RepID=A0A2H6KDM9_9APIC|nr:uncharacterized protein BOVATA_025960 [Babesia ovata]GBE61103.1 hypothetical protein, conserved [Babesia ovata]